MIVQEVAAKPYLAGNRVKALGTAALRRSESMPNLPTLDEQGLKGFEARSWFGLVTAAGTPDPIIARLSTVAQECMALPEVKSALAGQGVEAVGTTSAELGALVTAEIAKWGRVIREANITAN
jgi:tripartite-type tricarboxylate transporter receptor subunit TctC